MRLSLKVFLLSFPLLFTGCISTPKNITPIEYYTQPTTSEQTATIIGDMFERKYIADTIAYVFAIDQKKVENGPENLSNPLTISAGQHDIQVWCGRGGFKYTNLIKANFEAKKAYQIGYEMNPNKQEGCVFWITDLTTKKPITELVYGVEVGEYADPKKLHPLTHYLEPRPRINQGYTVPIRVINKMGHR
ncbi:MAG: hypothetical protein GAK29_03171 [Acinetobacter bereziniae]|uniref:Lipoprotein n=1 Tax=Acinetobacter bereziniae TaxID=106648 RepID=A0A833PDP5_ACIBZ|nr:MAG: hypothetical protein GAK29_03171 [Acinetobacter bereziniae]